MSGGSLLFIDAETFRTVSPVSHHYNDLFILGELYSIQQECISPLHIPTMHVYMNQYLLFSYHTLTVHVYFLQRSNENHTASMTARV